MSTDETPQPWQDQILPILKKFDVKHIAYVPDAGHSAAIRQAEADPDITAVTLTTEEEGIGYLAGAWLGGQRGAMLLQSSGVGNCINTLALYDGENYEIIRHIPSIITLGRSSVCFPRLMWRNICSTLRFGRGHKGVLDFK